MAEEKAVDVRMSVLVSRVLSFSGISRSHLELSKSWAKLIEYLNKELFDIRFLVSGSLVEMTCIEGSDVDQMQILSNIYASPNITEDGHFEGEICLMETENSRHGFTRISTTKNANICSEEMMPKAVRNIIDESTVEGEPSYISSAKFNAIVLKMMSGTNRYSSLGRSTSGIFQHGPCSTVEIEHTLQSDVAVGIECTSWPLDAVEWCSRIRHKGWPSEEMIYSLKNLPCYVLPVGDEQSQDYPVEWRFAFVPTERELIWGFNDTQIQCYALLKLLKKEFLEPIAPDQISSFFLKTIVFWEIENTGNESWHPKNLLFCVQLCLGHLTRSIKARDLPHYIFRKRNLLFTKFKDQEMQETVISKLQELQTSIASCVLQAGARYGPLKILYKLWEGCNRFLPDLIHEAEISIPESPELLKTFLANASLKRSQDVFWSIVQLRTTPEKLFHAIEYLKTNENISDVRLRHATLNCLKRELGKKLIPKIFKPETFATKDSLIKIIFGLFTEERKDSATGLLYLATLHYVLGNHFEAIENIRMFEKEKINMFYVGVSLSDFTMKNQSCLATKETRKISEETIAYDIVFTSGDVTWAPAAIRMECALLGDRFNWNFSIFHPVVYSYYLFCQICIDKKYKKQQCDHAIDELSIFLRTESLKIDSHRAYNLLGFCNYKAGYYQAAIACFQKSLQLMNSSGNAAAYHLCILIMDLMQKQEKQDTKSKY